jgi:cellulose synthase/poly-beta-1,6-N-acetylglucosamine synthase-like glycosyltransferase
MVTLSFVSASGTAATGLLTAYLTVISASALAQRRPAPGRSAAPTGSPNHRFAVMIPAHNEELGIAETLKTLRGLGYPDHLYEVHVVADNCSDATATVVTGHGCEVHERFAPDNPGKGPALNWLFERLMTIGRFDAFVVIDADTSVHPDFLSHMAEALDGGAHAAQGFYGVRDAQTSASAAFRLAALACRHHLRPLGRNAIGGSSGLFGNGMVFSQSILEANPWTGHLTEDMELQLRLLLQGHRVAYVPAAVVEAEMPMTLEASETQNERWELGRMQLAQAFVPRLARRIMSGPDRLASTDALLDEMVPPISVLAAANVVCAVGATALSMVHRSRVSRATRTISGMSCVALAWHVFVGLRSVGAPSHVYRSLLQAPKNIAWKVLLWSKVLARPQNVSWIRTPRNLANS